MAIQVVPAIVKLINLLTAAAGVKFAADSFGLTEAVMGKDDLTAATESIEKRQQGEYREAGSRLSVQAKNQDFISKLTPDPNDLMTMASLFQSGAYDDQLPLRQADSLVAQVANRLGKTPEELAAKTRPYGSPRQLLESGGY